MPNTENTTKHITLSREENGEFARPVTIKFGTGKVTLNGKWCSPCVSYSYYDHFSLAGYPEYDEPGLFLPQFEKLEVEVHLGASHGGAAPNAENALKKVDLNGDVPLPITVRIGETTLTLTEKLDPGCECFENDGCGNMFVIERDPELGEALLVLRESAKFEVEAWHSNAV